MKKLYTVFALILICLNLSAQNQKKEFTEAIEDNSFLIEEAFNQGKGVVQHLNVLNYDPMSKSWDYTFVQEWPLFGMKHQISYDLPLSFAKHSILFENFTVSYRYQLTYKDAWAAIAPRISMFVPINNNIDNNWGAQLNIPISKRLSNAFIAHFNAGLTTFFTRKADRIDNDRKILDTYHMGGSIMALISPKFNLILEYLVEADFNKIDYDYNQFTHTINPGFRYAMDWGKVEVVVGAAAPITLAKNQKTTTGMIFYLSFEHFFK
ncbi:MAG: hypothetical protein ACEPOV_07790 [Hyphomicrobiales bacterium]